MIIVIFVSTIFNIVRCRSANKSHSSSTSSLIPQRQSEVPRVNTKSNEVVSNDYETPITSGSGLQPGVDGNDYLKLEPHEPEVEENRE
jgi:hypothetical protein